MHPSQTKIDAILQIKPPTTRKQLRHFIGMVNYYRDVLPLRSHLLAPLSSLTSAKVKWKWTTEHQEAFKTLYWNGQLLYRDMWPLWSHLLAPLSSLTSTKVKWKWTTEHQDAFFDKMKALTAK
jgi:hypothetical protein